MSKVQITSDARQKLRKIQNGDVFDSPYVWITELMQNSYRARAKNVQFKIEGNVVAVVDDGVGSKSPKSILTLDYSDWESTDEGFGLGFWSVLAIPKLAHVTVVSKNWSALINITNLFATGVPEADVETDNGSIGGFGVRLISEWFSEHRGSITDEIRKVGETQPYNVYINDVLIRKRDITSDVNSEYRRVIENNKVSAVIGVTTNNWRSPTLYYERREIGHLSALEMNGITGIIELKPKALNLKEPDRKAVVKNNKYDSFVKMIHDEAVKMYLGFLENAPDEKVNEYANTIDLVVPVNAYENVLTTSDDIIAMTIESEGENEIDDTTAIAFPDATNITLAQYEQPSADVVGKIVAMPTPNTQVGTATHTHLGGVHKKTTLKEIVRATKKKVWIKASEMESLAEIKAKAEYYGVKVFVAKNVLHERAFEKWGVSHITALENGIVKRNIKTDVELKTDKEINFIRLLQPITKKYGLPENTFLIGNLKLIVETNLDGKVIDRDVKVVEGVKDGEHIILDRKSLGLKRFHLYGNGFGQHEMKALMANIQTIAHELAHLLYNTTDNTVGHYKLQEQIYEEIVGVYLTF
jgi:hypothetical protein